MLRRTRSARPVGILALPAPSSLPGDPAITRKLSQFECRTSRPRRVRQRQWTVAQVEAVRRVREAYPRWGKAKLTIVLTRQGVRCSVSTIGRMLTDLKGRVLLVEPRWVRAMPQARHPRPHAQCNGHVEHSHRTHREEFWECDDGDLDLPVVQPALRGWEEVYNTERPHHALGLRTPAQFLADWHAAQLSNRS